MGRLRLITELKVVRNRNNTRGRELAHEHLSIVHKRQWTSIITGNVVQTGSYRCVDQHIPSGFFKIRKERFKSYLLQIKRRTRTTAQRQPSIVFQGWKGCEKSRINRLCQQASILILIKRFRGTDGPVKLLCSVCCSHLNGRVCRKIGIQPIRRSSFDQIMANELIAEPGEQAFRPFT